MFHDNKMDCEGNRKPQEPKLRCHKKLPTPMTNKLKKNNTHAVTNRKKSKSLKARGKKANNANGRPQARNRRQRGGRQRVITGQTKDTKNGPKEPKATPILPEFPQGSFMSHLSTTGGGNGIMGPLIEILGSTLNEGQVGEDFFNILKYLVLPEVPEEFPLHNAILHRKLRKIYFECGMLTLGGLSMDNKDSHGQTALHLAVKNGYVDITKFLLECKADPSVKDQNGNNALHLAIRKEKSDDQLFGCFKLLSKSTHFLKMLIAINDQGFTPIHLAAYNGAFEEMILILGSGANINERDQLSGRTALFHAVEQNHAGIVIMLLNYGADKFIKNWAGHSPANSARKLVGKDEDSRLILQYLLN